MRYLFSILFLFVLCLAITAKPIPPTKQTTEPAKKTPAERLPTGRTCWGVLNRINGDFTLTGDEEWEGIGEMVIRKDGSVYFLIIWTLTASGHTGPGIYEFDAEGILTGRWGMTGSCQIEGDRLTGITYPDQIYLVEKTPCE